MKKAYLKELQGYLLGTVTDDADVREYFSTDASIFRIVPEGVIYPRSTADVQTTVAYLAERAKAGKHIGLIPRGHGTDQGGGAVGDGLQLVFPAHMNMLLRLDRDTVAVQPGMLYGTLQQTLQTHGRFLPPAPASAAYSTVGGAVANDAAGEKSLKYGPTHNFVKQLKVVLSDGSIITTRRLSARDLSRKKGQNDLEGAIYRGVDALLDDNDRLIRKHTVATSKNTTGYALGRIKGDDGSIDLTQLFIGSQGTLGVITEITFKTMPWNPRTSLLVGYFDDLAKAGKAVEQLLELKPAAIELVDYHLLEQMRQHRPHDLEGLVPELIPKLVLLIEFDSFSQLQQTVATRRTQRILRKYASEQRLAMEPPEQARLWKLRRSAAAVVGLAPGSKRALPFIDDAIVPVAKLPQLLEKTYKLLRQYDIEAAVWGHAGDGNIHLQPFLDLAKAKDVNKLFDLTRDFTALVIGLGGSPAGEHNDGLIRAPYLEQIYGPKVYELFRQIKQLCDPQGILNPGKKVDVSEEQTRQHVRSEYNLAQLYDFLPHN